MDVEYLKLHGKLTHLAILGKFCTGNLKKYGYWGNCELQYSKKNTPKQRVKSLVYLEIGSLAFKIRYSTMSMNIGYVVWITNCNVYTK